MLLAFGLIATAFTGRASAGEPQDWLPDEANVAAWVDVATLYKSPLAVREGWEEKSRAGFVNKTTILVPGLDRLMLAAQMDFEPGLPTRQDYSIGVPSKRLTLDSLSLLTGAKMEKLSERPAVLSHDGQWVVETADGAWLSAGRGGRQALSRWLARGPVAKSSPSSLLREEYATRSPAAVIGMVVDLRDSVSSATAGRFIEALLKEERLADVNTANATGVLVSARSAKLEVTVDDAIRGKLAVNFEQSATPLAPMVKVLVPHVLRALGASPGATEDWTWRIDSHAIIGEGPLTVAEVRRILSLLKNPLEQSSSAGNLPATTQSPDPLQLTIAASQKYFHSVDTLLDDLQDAMKRSRDNHMTMLERSADKLDKLPLLNVDEDLLNFGRRASSSLRYQANALRNAGLQRGVMRAASGADAFYSVGQANPYGAWSTAGLASNGDGMTIDLTVNANAKTVQLSEMKQVREGLVETRAALTRKYKAEF
ncbi:MAG: hypothetical protein C0478_16945 [Planctomyces sp.]|nr:hypothetical protein [Planctomyces sp.]